MVGSSVAGSRSSVRTRSVAASTPIKPGPHILGGSKNLRTERYRREQAEQDLLKTRQSLKAVASELAPQVDELSKAIKMMQIEKHHQLHLDETSHQVLESLQEQIDAIDARDAQFNTELDKRMEVFLQQVQEDFHREKYELQVYVTQVQESQDTLLAEVRLLQYEVVATKQFLAKQLDRMDDALDSLRGEVQRTKDQQALTNQAIQQGAVAMDERVFQLDKEILKVKLALPSSVSAQLPPTFMEGISMSDAAKAAVAIDANRLGVGVSQKIHELETTMDALRAELTAYRAADRQQFDTVTNRLRESAKSHQSLKKDVDGRFLELQQAYDTMATKVPSELARRFLAAQKQWENELVAIRLRVDELGATESKRLPLCNQDQVELYDASALRSMDTAIRRHEESINEVVEGLQGVKTDVETMYQGHESMAAALQTAVGRVEQDVLGLYDWAKTKLHAIQEEVTFTASVLKYFQQHAKILPTS